MAEGRWYPTVTPLRNGEMLITEGGPYIPEVRTTGGTLRSLTGASLNLPLYPWMDVAPNGRAFYSGPDQAMRSLDTSGTGSWQTFGQRDPIHRSYGGHALFDVGKILVAGGGSSSADARVIDINGPTPQVTPTAPMANGRRQHNLTVLADGTVLRPVATPPAPHSWTSTTASTRPSSGTRRRPPGKRLPPNRRPASTTPPRCCCPMGACCRPGRHLRRVRPGRLSREERAGLHAAVPVQPGRSARPAPGDLRCAGQRHACHQLPDRHPRRRFDPQGRARPPRRRHALGQYGAALRAAVVHRRRRHADRDFARERQHRPARRLHAVHHRRQRRPLDRQDGHRRRRRSASSAAAPELGLVGAWGFSEGSGGTTADGSGNGNTGTITGATWTTQGRYGNALSFNGTSNVVRVPSSASLNLTTGMTLSAWIRPTASQGGWRTILQRQADAYFLTASNGDRCTPRAAGPSAGAPSSPAAPRPIR